MKKQGSVVRGQAGQALPPDVLPPAITAQTVKDALEKLGGAGSAAVADHLQAQTYMQRILVRKVLSSLLQAGGVKAVMQQGVVIYHLTDKPSVRGSVQAKLWEFACLRFATAKPFTAAEAARLAEHDRDYTKRYCRWLCNSGYLAIVSRGRAGAWLYQVVGGKEHESAPVWNRRAEKRKSVGQGPPPAVLPVSPASPSPQPSPARGEGDKDHRLEACATGREAGATKLDAVLEELRRTIVEIAGGCERAVEIVREMNETLQKVEEQGHDEPGEPTEGHH